MLGDNQCVLRLNRDAQHFNRRLNSTTQSLQNMHCIVYRKLALLNVVSWLLPTSTVESPNMNLPEHQIVAGHKLKKKREPKSKGGQWKQEKCLENP